MKWIRTKAKTYRESSSSSVSRFTLNGNNIHLKKKSLQENILGKGENAGNLHSPLYLQLYFYIFILKIFIPQVH